MNINVMNARSLKARKMLEYTVSIASNFSDIQGKMLRKREGARMFRDLSFYR